MFVATETDIYKGTPLNLPVMLVAKKQTGIYNEKSGHFKAVFVATKPDIYDEISGHFPAVLVATKPAIYDENSGHIQA